MEEVTLQKEALNKTQQNILNYFQTHDLKYIAEDAVYLAEGRTIKHSEHP